MGFIGSGVVGSPSRGEGGGGGALCVGTEDTGPGAGWLSPPPPHPPRPPPLPPAPSLPHGEPVDRQAESLFFSRRCLGTTQGRGGEPLNDPAPGLSVQLHLPHHPARPPPTGLHSTGH